MKDMNNNTMKVMLLEKHGEPYKVATLPRPVAGKGQVR
jgi:hypothetical protein